jgi:hypothetical protein
MTTEQAKLIAQLVSDPTRVYLALDRDAFLKALKLQTRHKHVLPMKVLCLDKDIKDVYADVEIQKLIDGAVSDDRRNSTTSGDLRKEGGV